MKTIANKYRFLLLLMPLFLWPCKVAGQTVRMPLTGRDTVYLQYDQTLHILPPDTTGVATLSWYSIQSELLLLAPAGDGIHFEAEVPWGRGYVNESLHVYDTNVQYYWRLNNVSANNPLTMDAGNGMILIRYQWDNYYKVSSKN